MSYEIIVTSVHDRRDLLARTLRSLLLKLDAPPVRVLVHEDIRADRPFVAGETEALVLAIEREHGVPVQLLRTNPAGGLARALRKLLDEARTEFILYTQEDFDTVRSIPASACVDLMAKHELHHVRFNKRKTMRIKGEHRDPREWWTKQTHYFDEHPLTLSDNWYFQTSVWRRSIALDGFRAVVERVRPGEHVQHAEIQFQRWFHRAVGQNAGTVDGHQEARRLYCRTWIWGKIGEPAFIAHTGSERRTQGWVDPAHDAKFGTVRGEKPNA